MDRLSSYSPHALAVLRIVTAVLFFAHGTQKLLNSRRCREWKPEVGCRH